MPIQCPLTPGEIKILRALERALPPEEARRTVQFSQFLLSYTELREETRLSDPVLSGYLKNLQKMAFIKRDIDTRKYHLTRDNGEVALRILHIIETLNSMLASKNARPLSAHKPTIDKISEGVRYIKAKLIAEALKSKQASDIDREVSSRE